MNLRNVLKPGEYVTVVPIGVPCVLEYDDRGILQHAYTSFEHTSNSRDDELKEILYQAKKVPGKITITTGTSWIFGIIYTDKKFMGEGYFPDCILDEAIKYLKTSNATFNYFASYVESQAMKFKGATDTNSWIGMNHFNLLPGFVVPVNVNSSVVKSILIGKRFQFNTDLIMEYISFSNDQHIHSRTTLYQIQVSEIATFFDRYGHVKCRLSDSENSVHLDCNISDVYSREIHKSDYVIYDKSDNSIVFSFRSNNRRRSQYSDSYNCPVCGTSTTVSNSGVTSCSNPNCLSNQFNAVHHFLKRLQLPEMSFEEYIEFISVNPDFKLGNIFTKFPYSEEHIECTLEDMISAVTPISVVSNEQVFKDLVTKNNNNLDSLVYTISHPDRIVYMLITSNDQFDLGYSNQVRRLVNWLKDEYNLSNILDLLSSNAVTISKSNKKFEGAPIFRNKRILITGKFVNGGTDDIVAILSSYSADVVTKFDDDVDCVVTGSTAEDINGNYIRQARTRRIPIYDEITFFKTYEIDKDLVQNLL